MISNAHVALARCIWRIHDPEQYIRMTTTVGTEHRDGLDRLALSEAIFVLSKKEARCLAIGRAFKNKWSASHRPPMKIQSRYTEQYLRSIILHFKHRPRPRLHFSRSLRNPRWKRIRLQCLVNQRERYFGDNRAHEDELDILQSAISMFAIPNPPSKIRARCQIRQLL